MLLNGDHSDSLTIDEVVEILKNNFKELRLSVFSILPSDCFLKQWNMLNVLMVGLVDKKAVDDKLIDSRDICALCAEKECIHYNVDNRDERIRKVYLTHKVLLEDYLKKISSG